MIVQPGLQAPPHFFLIGYRAPPGGFGTDFEEVGTVVVRQAVDFAGAAADAGEVLKEDKAFEGQPPEGPFRYESEIAAWKPAPDVVVVDELASFLTPVQIADPDLPQVLAAQPFGTLQVDRGTGFAPATARSYGWLPRNVNPRLAMAGRAGPANDPSSLEGFDAHQFKLPDDFDNRFLNGRALAGPLFKAGDRLRFTRTVGNVVNNVTIPAAPALAVTRDGEPLDPPLTLTPLVDTVVLDRGVSTFTLVWRATFPWDPVLETATLEVG